MISISQARDTVSVYVGDVRYQLERIADVLAKTNQAVATLETYSGRLDQVSSRLTALEFQSAVTLDDVLVVLQRAEMATRMGEEIERNVIELGREGWLIEMQLDELMEDVPRDRVNVVRDYAGEDTGGRATVRGAWRTCSHTVCSVSSLAECLGHGGVNPLDQHLTPRGYRALAQSRGSPTTSSAPSSRRSAGSTSSSARSLRELESWTASAPRRPARSARDCAGCRSTT